MAQNITLLGASYSDVPSVLLPKTGGGTAQFDDTSDADATAADIASGKTAYVNGEKVTGTGSGGGGAANIVQGTFTTGSTRGGTGTVSIPYTGSGYPIALIVYVDGGPYNSNTSGNTDWYNSVARYDIGYFSMVKSRTTTVPTYATSGADNYGTVAFIYKNSTSSSTAYSRNSSMTANSYTSSSGNASSASKCCVFKGNGKTLAYYIGNNSSSAYGLMPGIKYAYIAVYSS